MHRYRKYYREEREGGERGREGREGGGEGDKGNCREYIYIREKEGKELKKNEKKTAILSKKYAHHIDTYSTS